MRYRKKGKYCPNFKCNRIINQSPSHRWVANPHIPLITPLAYRRLQEEEWRRCHKCGIGHCKPKRCKKGFLCYFCINKLTCYNPVK